MKSNKHLGFTLAEVLVTLAIIGVVASMTIPTLLNNTSDSQHRAALKKKFSELSQATQMLNLSGGIDHISTPENFRDSFDTQLKFIKKDTSMNIFAPSYNYYKNTSIPGQIINAINNTAVSLTDGSSISFVPYWVCSTRMGLDDVCGLLYIDTNGKKGPNMIGKDFNVLFLVNTKGDYRLKPAGTDEDTTTCVAGSGNESTSYGCTAALLKNGDMP